MTETEKMRMPSSFLFFLIILFVCPLFSCKPKDEKTDSEKMQMALEIIKANGLIQNYDIDQIQLSLEILADNNYLKDTASLNAGDVIWANRMYRGYPINHSGIFVGNGRVIHFTTIDKNDANTENAVIHESSFEDFALNCRVRVINFPESFSPEETVERARSRLGEKGYDIISNNCDHFATWCKTGKNMSMQVDGLESIMEMTGLDPRNIEKIKKIMNNKF